MSTDPASGVKAHVDDMVDLTVSNGNVTLPDVTGQSIGAAASLLSASDLGLTPKPQADPTCPTAPGTLVHSQSLPPGEVPQGSTVVLTYCTGTS
jgi:serine/threonine-protein kinase